MASTPIRGLRIPDDEWASIVSRAEGAGVSATAFIRARCLEAPPPTDRGAKIAELEDQKARRRIAESAKPCAHRNTTSRGPLKDCDDCGLTLRLNGEWS